MKKIKYRITFIGITLIAIVVFIIYINICNGEIKNILGNIFAGLITGEVIAILSNLKNKYLYENTKRIKHYQEQINKSQDIILTQINLQTKEKITIVELIDLYTEIYNNLKIYYEIEDIKIKECINNINKDWIEIDKEITKIIEDLSTKMMQENSISLDNYKRIYQSNLANFIWNIHSLQESLKKDLYSIIDDTEKLSKSII